MRYATNKEGVFNARWKSLIMFAFLAVLFVMVLIKFITLRNITTDYIVAAYSILVASYIFVRFGLSYLYEPDEQIFDYSYLPTITIAIPAKNEEKGIYSTIISSANVDYPRNYMKIIVINDGSTDKTLSEMKRAKRAAEKLGVKTEIVDWKVNRGKREGMAEAVRIADSEIIVFIDSDSYIQEFTLRELVKYFTISDSIGGVTAHTYVTNLEKNLLTQLQSLHYYISFKVFKSTEALFGNVTCCPGCCTAYRLAYIKKDMEEWSKESFLGVRCTFGDDRSLTNFLLKRNYQTVISPTAIAHTIVPERLRQFFKQQLRWKKSWARETLLASKFFWKKNMLMAALFYLGFFLTLMTPFVVIRALVWYPMTTGQFAFSYFLGLLLTSLFFSLYYRLYTGAEKWYLGIFYSFFYSLVLSWQLIYAIITIRDQSWGTR